MPVELEGYIRPGCTILTAFIAMPKPMWLKLLKEPAPCLKNFIASPGNLLFGRGTMLVYLNAMVFRVTKDATSVVKIKVKDRAPKLHYIHPTCFEAGRPMEFVACGSDLLQSKFRLLVSFAGRYLAHDIFVSSMCYNEGDVNSFDHQLLKIHVPQSNMDLFGPAFIEVENQSGLSNFIPILVGDREICTEMEILQQKFDMPHFSQERQRSPLKSACEVFASRQAQFSEFVLEVAWLLKKPVPEQQLTSSHVERFNHLLTFLIERESSVILERVFCSVKSALDNNVVAGISDADMRSLQNNMETAQKMIDQKLQENDFPVMPASDGIFFCQSSQNDNHSVVPATNQGVQRKGKSILGVRVFSPSLDEGVAVPLLDKEVVMNVKLQELPGKPCRQLLTTNRSISRPLFMATVAIFVCFGVCACVFLPKGGIQIATTIRMSMFDNS